MNLETFSSSIRANGTRVLEELDIERKFGAAGKLFFTGSYALDLMTWKDIDMQVVFSPGKNPLTEFLKLFEEIIQNPGYIEGQITHFKDEYKPAMPRGVYLGMKIDFPNFGGIWKLDFWCLEKGEFEKNRKLLELLRERLTPELRNSILNMKRELMEKTGRVPQLGSHFLYQAVLLEKLTTKAEIYSFLRARGVAI